MRKIGRKILRDRLMWVLARVMTPLFQGVDQRKGDTLSFTITRTRFTQPNKLENGVEGEVRESYVYHWTLEDNTDAMYHILEQKKLNEITMELDPYEYDEEEIDMEEFFEEKSTAGGWTKGRIASSNYKKRPSVADQRLMSIDELLDISTEGFKYKIRQKEEGGKPC